MKSFSIISFLFVLFLGAATYFKYIPNLPYYLFKSYTNEKNIKIDRCKLQLFDGWVLNEVKKQQFLFMKFDYASRSLDLFSILNVQEDLLECNTQLLNGFEVCGQYREKPNGKTDSIYYIKDAEIKLFIINAKSFNNNLIEKFAKNLTCENVIEGSVRNSVSFL